MAIPALFSHCKRDENNGLVVIAGTVTDAFTGEAVANVSVNILIKGIVDGVFNNNFQDVAQDVTSTNGEYRLEFEKGTPTTYRFEVDGSGYYFLQQDENPDDYTTNNDNDLNLKVNSQAWLKVRVVNEGTANNGDNITFGLNTENNGCIECCSSGVVELNGDVDETQICELFGGSYAFVDGVATDFIFGQTNIHDSVYVVPQDTTELKVSF